MDATILSHAALLLLGVFVSAVAQVMLKKAALRGYESALREYLNPLVVGAYALFVGTTFLSILAYRAIPLSMGPILESTSYCYVTAFGVLVFHERMTRTKWIALALILAGICVYSVGMA